MDYIINEMQDKITLRDFLKNELSLSSRLIKKLKRYKNSISVNGVHANVTHILKANDVVSLDFSDKEEDVNEHLVKTNIKLDVIYEDENITVINKSANMPTHQSLNHYTDTLANALAYRYRNRPYVFRAINRLDKDTSGVVLTANNSLFADILSDKLQNGKFKKEYLAIVVGETPTKGVINFPIARERESIIKRIVSKDGEEAITEYKTIATNGEISIVSVRPITGRTHQIRVHMASISHPILGDSLYGESSALIDRQALHAIKLSVDGIGEFFADVPLDMKEIIGRYFKYDEILSKI